MHPGATPDLHTCGSQRAPQCLGAGSPEDIVAGEGCIFCPLFGDVAALCLALSLGNPPDVAQLTWALESKPPCPPTGNGQERRVSQKQASPDWWVGRKQGFVNTVWKHGKIGPPPRLRLLPRVFSTPFKGPHHYYLGRGFIRACFRAALGCRRVFCLSKRLLCGCTGGAGLCSRVSPVFCPWHIFCNFVEEGKSTKPYSI